MSRNDRTKEYYAEALEVLLQTRPFEKIQVKDLCNYCNTTRTTFYYHFRDKYDLVAWMFNQDYHAVFYAPDADMTVQTAEKLLARMYQKKSFYKKVFSDHSQNSIRSYMQTFNVKNGQLVVKYAYGVEMLTDEQLYLIRHFSYGCTQMLMDWLLDRFSMPVSELARLQYQVMPAFLNEAYQRYYRDHPQNNNL